MDLDVDLINEMRNWIADCEWTDLTPDDITELDDELVIAGVETHYEGGVAAFLAAA